MNKRRFTHKIVSLFLIGCMGFSLFIPQCYATTIPSLGPAELKEFAQKNISGVFIMDSYAENIQKQSTADLSTVNLIENDFKTKIVQHHNQAKQHAIEWQQDIKVSMLETNQTITQFNHIFQETAGFLAEAIEKKIRIEQKRRSNNYMNK